MPDATSFTPPSPGVEQSAVSNKCLQTLIEKFRECHKHYNPIGPENVKHNNLSQKTSFSSVSVVFNVTAFIIFPVKYNDELEREGINDWDFGWAYGLGWAVTVLMSGSAILLWLDKDADEIIFREKTSYNNDGIEEVRVLRLRHMITVSLSCKTCPREFYS